MRMTAWKRNLGYALAQIITVVAIIALWEWASTTDTIDTYFFGTPSDIWESLTDWAQDGLFSALGSTLLTLLLGFAIGTVFGIAVGVLIAASTLARHVLEPFLAFINGMPRLVLQPFLVIWLGFGMLSHVTLIVLVIWIIVTVTIAAAFAELESDLLAHARMLGAGRLSLARHVYAPHLAVWVLSSARVTFGLAFQAAVVAEFIGAAQGLGHFIIMGQASFNVDAIYAGLVVVTIVAAVCEALISRLEARATRWMPPAGT